MENLLITNHPLVPQVQVWAQNKICPHMFVQPIKCFLKL